MSVIDERKKNTHNRQKNERMKNKNDRIAAAS